MYFRKYFVENFTNLGLDVVPEVVSIKVFYLFYHLLLF